MCGWQLSGSLVRCNSSTRRLSMEVVADFWLYILITNNSISDLLAGCIRPRLSNNLGYFEKCSQMFSCHDHKSGWWSLTQLVRENPEY